MSESPDRVRAVDRVLELGGRPWLMGIVNASPDSFSDGGRFETLQAQVELARELLEDGADILDIGGESATTGRPAVSVEQEIERVVPLIEHVAGELGAIVSVDTYKPPVARAAIAAGATIVNDVSGLRDPRLAEVCAQSGAALVLMHTRAAPKQRLQDPDLYGDVARRGLRLPERAHRAGARRRRESRAADPRPGPGFRKDARPDDRAARGHRPPARAGASAADGDLAQGLHRGAHRPPPARAPGEARWPRSPTAWTRARGSSGSTTSPPLPTS